MEDSGLRMADLFFHPISAIRNPLSSIQHVPELPAGGEDNHAAPRNFAAAFGAQTVLFN